MTSEEWERQRAFLKKYGERETCRQCGHLVYLVGQGARLGRVNPDLSEHGCGVAAAPDQQEALL